METGTASPVPGLGNNLATFLAARLSGSFDNLNCKNYGLTDPVTLTADGNGVATAATFNTTRQKPRTRAAAGRRRPRRRAAQLVGRLHAGPERARIAAGTRNTMIHGAGRSSWRPPRIKFSSMA